MHNIRTYENTISISELHLQLKWTAYEVVGVAADGGDEELRSPPRVLGPAPGEGKEES